MLIRNGSDLTDLELLLKVCGKFHCYREMDTIFSGIIADTLFFVSSQKLGYQRKTGHTQLLRLGLTSIGLVLAVTHIG